MTANQLEYNKLQETKRANLAKEEETFRSNKAKEDENYRSNLAKEQETARHNKEEEISNRSKALNNPFSLISYGARNSPNIVEGIGNIFTELAPSVPSFGAMIEKAGGISHSQF